MYSPKLTATSALCAPMARVGRQDVVAQIALRHPLAQRREPGFVGGDRHVVRALHQRDLRGRLDHAAAGGDRIGADVIERRRFGLDAVHDEEAQPLLDADAAGRDAAILEDLRDRAVRALVFLPGADVGAELDQLARPRLLEAGADPRELALGRDDGDEGTLALAPPHAGEIEHARCRPRRGWRRCGCSVISRRALSMRARRSSIVIGTMPAVIGRSAPMDGGTAAAPCGPASASRRTLPRRPPAPQRPTISETSGDLISSFAPPALPALKGPRYI